MLYNSTDIITTEECLDIIVNSGLLKRSDKICRPSGKILQGNANKDTTLDFINNLIIKYSDDEKDDNEIDNTKRLYKIVEEIKRLSKLKNEIELHYKSNTDKFIHNNNLIKEIANEQRTINFFLSLSNKITYKSIF